MFRNGICGGLNMDFSIENRQACFIAELFENGKLYSWGLDLKPVHFIMEMRQFIRFSCVCRMGILEPIVIWPLCEIENQRDFFEVVN